MEKIPVSTVVRCVVILVCCIAFLGITIGLVLLHGWPDQQAKIIFCDVGQGDGIVITQGFTQIIIDVGPDPAAMLACLENHMPWFDRSLELVVFTHPDFDHIGAGEAVLDRFLVQKIMLTTDAKNNDAFRRFRAAVLRQQEQGSELIHPRQEQQGKVGRYIEYQVVSPLESMSFFTNNSVYNSSLSETELSDALLQQDRLIKNHNDRSISLFITIKGTSFLATGDIEHNTEQALLRTNMLMKAQLLKIAHHGSKTSTTVDFLASIAPEAVFISAGANNRYGHPAEVVVSRLEKQGSQIWRTDQDGEILVTINDDGYQVHTKEMRK